MKVIFSITLMCACTTQTIAQSVMDVDGNEYPTIIIGSQVWMAQSLRSTHFSNGDAIPTTTPATLNISAEQNPIYQWAYDGVDSLAEIFGRLYTWYAVEDSRNVCPAGWHVPSSEAFDTLNNYLGGATVAGGKMKEIGTAHWLAPNIGATNETGFTGRPNGNRNLLGFFNDMGIVSDMWSATPGINGAWDCDLNYDSEGTASNDDPKAFAFAIRCLRNEPALWELSNVKIFKLPAESTLVINTNGIYLLQYTLYSADGKKINSDILFAGENAIDLSALASGVYVVQIAGETGTTEYKFIHTQF